MVPGIAGKTESTSTRQLSDRLVLTVCLIFLFRLFAVEIYRIPTHSMMPTLVGPHHSADCPLCGFHLKITGPRPDTIDPCRCPNCRQSIRPAWSPVPADRALVLKQGATGIHRYDVVAFKSPDDPRTPFVKRIVGLPGETISVRDGDICRQNPQTGQFEICPKPIEHIIESARVVYDDRYRVPNLPVRWCSTDNSWQTETNGYRLIEREGKLTYHHLGPSGLPEPIGDDEPFHPRPPASRHHVVHDLLVEWTWHPAHPDSEITLHFAGPSALETIRITPKEVSLGRASVELSPISKSSRLRWGYVDGAWIGWQDDRVLGRWIDPPIESSTTYEPSVGIQVSFGGIGEGSKLTDLVLRRDLHYRAYAWEVSAPISADPILGDPTSVWMLGPDEFLVLGDNTIKSRDSRHWQHGPGVPARMILGKVVARFSSTRPGWIHRLARTTEDPGTIRARSMGPMNEPMAGGNDSRSATR